jgi:Domain of unknown function (DUF1707)
VADVQPSQIRIGDTERESALTSLGDHMSAGRLDIDEYGDRTARVSTAKTRGELLALFEDLPEPHPRFGPALPPPPAAVPLSQPVPQQSQAPAPSAGTQISHRVMSAAVPLAGLVAVALFFVTHVWVFFLIPAAVVIFGGAIFGEDWKHQRHNARDADRQRRRDMRRGGRW